MASVAGVTAVSAALGLMTGGAQTRGPLAAPEVSRTVAQIDSGVQKQAKAKQAKAQHASAEASRARASRSHARTALTHLPVTASSATLKAGARRHLASRGHGAAQFSCFDKIITRESTWNPRAVNPSSGAGGLAQALPMSKMASAGADYRTNAMTQIKWALNYMTERYGSPCGAWAFWQSHRWY